MWIQIKLGRSSGYLPLYELPLDPRHIAIFRVSASRSIIKYTCSSIVIYFQPEISQENESVMSNCSEPRNYTGEVCFEELTMLQLCYSSEASVRERSNVNIPSGNNQETGELTVSRLLQGLPLLSPSPECEEAIKPFLCLYLFGSCDTDNQLHQATQADCLRLRDGVCTQEWVLAVRFLGPGVLPDCDALTKQEDAFQCQGL